jgi:ubiquinone/menaquinone biosynthesis C-methylase UbiE
MHEHIPSPLIEKLNSLEDYFRLSLCPARPCTALDIGCGTGRFVEKMKKVGINAHGIELSQNLLLSAEDPSSLILADAHNLPYADDSFDFVTSHSVYHELDPAVSLSEMIRVLKPGGILNIIDVAMIVDQKNVQKRLQRITQQLIRRILFIKHFGLAHAYELTQYLQSNEWKHHRRGDRVTTLDDFTTLRNVFLPDAETGLTGNGVLAYLNWRKTTIAPTAQ